MMRKTSLIFPGGLAGVALTLLVTQSHTANVGASAKAASSDTYRQLNLFGDVFERVRAEYVDPVNDKDLVENSINGMLTGLDPHSSYMNAKAFRDMQVQTKGEFGGLGIEVTQDNGFIKVISPIDDTPASRAGVRSRRCQVMRAVRRPAARWSASRSRSPAQPGWSWLWPGVWSSPWSRRSGCSRRGPMLRGPRAGGPQLSETRPDVGADRALSRSVATRTVDGFNLSAAGHRCREMAAGR